MRTPPLALATIILLAGCLSPITEKLRAGNVEEPRWSVGDWWTYDITSDTIDLTGTVTIVVAQAHESGYILGIPTDAEANAALLYHMPPIGPVGRDLSWDVHETRFEPAAWPLRDGHTWDTTWITANVKLTSHLNGTLWSINNSGYETDSGSLYEIVYDPAVQQITSFVRTDLDGNIRQSMTLTDNGTGYNGTLRAPQYIEIAYLDSRTRGTLQGTLPAAPNPRFTLTDTVDTALVGCLAGGAEGQYHTEVISPAGGICTLDETIQPGDTRIRASVVEVTPVSAEDGEWEARMLALGTGSATVEVLAWPTLNYTIGS